MTPTRKTIICERPKCENTDQNNIRDWFNSLPDWDGVERLKFEIIDGVAYLREARK
jgi:hypothetical protein